MLFLRSCIPAVAIALIASTFGQTISAEQEVGDSSDTLLTETNPPTLPIIEVTIPAGVSTYDEDIADVIDSLIRADSNGGSQTISAEQEVGDSSDTLLTETNPPTLPIIEVTIPAGVSTYDEDIADVIDALIRADSNGGSKVPKPNPPPPPPPQNQQASRKEAMFRQQFAVQNNREFADEELELFQDLLEQYTLYFAPLSPIEMESEWKIVTDCTVHRQFLLHEGDRKLDSVKSKNLRYGSKRRELQDQSLTTLQLDFTMTYESMHYNVTEYPKLFQNWMANNGNVVLEQMQFLNMDIVSVEMPRRIVVMKPEPTSPPTSLPVTKEVTTPEPTSPPTSLPVTKEVTTGGEGILLPDSNIAMPPVPIQELPSKWSMTAIILFSVAMVIAIAILTVAVSIFLGHRQSSNSHEVMNGDPEAPRTNGGTEAAWKSTAALGGSSRYEENTLSTMDLELVESSSSVFP